MCNVNIVKVETRQNYLEYTHFSQMCWEKFSLKSQIFEHTIIGPNTNILCTCASGCIRYFIGTFPT